VVVTGLIAQQLGAAYAQGFVHTFASGGIFLVALACLLGVHSIIRVVQTRGRTQSP
jgi:hypothetical protein